VGPPCIETLSTEDKGARRRHEKTGQHVLEFIQTIVAQGTDAEHFSLMDIEGKSRKAYSSMMSMAVT